ncbi:hypothetical protein M9458_021753, partial [Cirrhinus mrigala]
LPHRRVTFSTANPMQDQQDSSQQSYYDSGLEEALRDHVSAHSPYPRTTTNGPPQMAASERWNTQKLVGR